MQQVHSPQTAIKILVVIGAIWGILNARTILFPVIVAVVLTFILHPLVELFVHTRCYPLKRTFSRTAAIFLSFLVTAGVFAVLITFVIVPFAHEFERFAVNLPNYMKQTQELIFHLQQSAQQMELPESLENLLREGMSDAAGYSVDLGRRFLSGTIGFASRVVDLVVVPVLTFYFLKDWTDIRDSFVKLAPAGQRTRVRQIIEDVGLVISGYIRGQIAVSAIMGVMVFVGMYAFKMNYALTIGLIAALTEFVPIIGPIIGSIPALLVALLVSPMLAAKVAIFYIIMHQAENHIIVPKVMGKSIDLHPVTVILAFLIGAQLFGLAGMILAVPVAAILKVLFYHVWDNR